VAESHKVLVYPVYLALPQISARLPSLQAALVPLCSTVRSARLLGVDLYYRAVADMGLLALNFEAASVSALLIDKLADEAARGQGAILDTARLQHDTRLRFHESYLPLFELAARGLPSPDQALRVLARHLRGVAGPGVIAARSRPTLEVRYRRGDTWLPGRLSSLTREGVFIATGAPPRVGEEIDLALSGPRVRLSARAQVVRVTGAEAAAILGAAGFGARFRREDREDAERIDLLVNRAGGDPAAEVAPPPRRREPRFPVRVAVRLRTVSAQNDFTALDVSRHGVFISADAVAGLTGAPVQLTLPLEDGEEPVQASGRVARVFDAEDARSRELPPGIGVELTAIATADEPRWGAFVDRVSRRMGRQVVVGASAARLQCLLTALAAAGYNASGATDAPGLVAKAAAPMLTPDLVVIDISLARENPRATQAARRALLVRAVPTLAVGAESPGTVRRQADSMLI
jgi:hypothetical protein